MAYQVLLDLSAPAKSRREYPEVSYSVIAALVSGAMGIEPAHAGDDYDVQTLPQPMTKADELSVTSLRIKSNVLDVSHTSDAGTRMSNRSGPPIRWRAAFLGAVEKLSVNGRSVPAEHGFLPGGMRISWTTTNLPSGGSVTVSRQ